MDEIKQAKIDFLNRYNPMFSEELALSSGINAATKRNPTYTPALMQMPAAKEAIHLFWQEQLQRLGAKYVFSQTMRAFLSDVLELKNRMNQQFPNDFQNAKAGYDHEFRIAHAQKSLSVYLKHLWCMGLREIPPMCPIDGRILTIAHVQGTWTKVNSIETYLDLINGVREFASVERPDLELAEWELLRFL